MEIVRPLFFSKQFQAYHGLTPEQYLSGMSKSSIGGQIFIHNTPEERDAWIKENLGQRHYKGPYREGLEQVLSTPANIPQVIAKYRHGPSEVGVSMNPLAVARDLRDLTAEMSANARPNDRILYRGSERHPIEDASNNQPISFSENRGAANAFAKYSRGEVFKVAKGTVRGLRMEDYGVTPMTVGPRRISEAEWLVDPVSFRSSLR
jgi:hypothetical protein